MNKRSTLVTFASAAVLLGLFNINNSQTVKADTVEQPATDQRNTQTTTANNQNSKSVLLLVVALIFSFIRYKNQKKAGFISYK